MRGCSICFFLILFVCLTAQSQQSIPVTANNPHKDSLPKPILIPSFLSSAIAERTSNANAVKIIPPSYYSNSLPFFCKKELQLQKLVNFSIKMRVGSVEYSDKMEGKNH